MIFFIFTFFPLVALTSFGYPDYVKAYDKTADKEIKKLVKKEGLWVYGSGGSFCDRILQPYYAVYSTKQMEQDEAVEYYIRIFNQMLSAINNSKEIRFYLYEYPLTDQSLQLRMNFGKEYGKKYSPPYVSSIFNVDGYLLVMSTSEEGEAVKARIPFEIKLTKSK